jgi:hypothetical protein
LDHAQAIPYSDVLQRLLPTFHAISKYWLEHVWPAGKESPSYDLHDEYFSRYIKGGREAGERGSCGEPGEVQVEGGGGEDGSIRDTAGGAECGGGAAEGAAETGVDKGHRSPKKKKGQRGNKKKGKGSKKKQLKEQQHRMSSLLERVQTGPSPPMLNPIVMMGVDKVAWDTCTELWKDKTNAD